MYCLHNLGQFTQIVPKEVFFCECAIYKFTHLVCAKNYNELLQSVPLFTANNVYFGFIRYIRLFEANEYNDEIIKQLYIVYLFLHLSS